MARLPKMKTEKILMIIIGVLIVLIVLYWLFNSMSRGTHEGFADPPPELSYTFSLGRDGNQNASARGNYNNRVNENYHQIMKATIPDNSYAKPTYQIDDPVEKDSWNDCADLCTHTKTDCKLFSANKTGTGNRAKVKCTFYKGLPDYSKVNYTNNGNNHIWIRAGNNNNASNAPNIDIKDTIFNLKSKLNSCNDQNRPDDYTIDINGQCYKTTNPVDCPGGTIDSNGDCIITNDAKCKTAGYSFSKVDRSKCISNDEDYSKLVCKGGEAKIVEIKEKKNGKETGKSIYKIDCKNGGVLSCDDPKYLLGNAGNCKLFEDAICDTGYELKDDKCVKSTKVCADNNYEYKNGKCQSKDYKSKSMCPKGYKDYGEKCIKN
jgi:hypothetical protein